MNKKRQFVMVDKVDWGEAAFGLVCFLYGLFNIGYIFWMSYHAGDPITALVLTFSGVLLAVLGLALLGDSKSKEKQYVTEEEDC